MSPTHLTAATRFVEANGDQLACERQLERIAQGACA